MPALFDYFHRLKSRGGDKKQNTLPRGDKRRQTGHQDQGERIERPYGRVVVVIVRIQPSRSRLFLGDGMANAIQMIEMRVDGFRAVSGMNVLERRQKKGEQQRQAHLYAREAAYKA
jgi:hypothetical protein